LPPFHTKLISVAIAARGSHRAQVLSRGNTYHRDDVDELAMLDGVSQHTDKIWSQTESVGALIAFRTKLISLSSWPSDA
jgi:hypothetical protein